MEACVMTNEKLCSMVDHTVLAQTATWEDIKALCDDAMAYKTASVCIPPAMSSRPRPTPMTSP